MPANLGRRVQRLETTVREHQQELRTLRDLYERHDYQLTALETRVRLEELVHNHERRLVALEGRGSGHQMKSD